eukprot:scaffold138652_cov21-Tisochrysis_lutea.AAC.3
MDPKLLARVVHTAFASGIELDERSRVSGFLRFMHAALPSGIHWYEPLEVCNPLDRCVNSHWLSH